VQDMQPYANDYGSKLRNAVSAFERDKQVLAKRSAEVFAPVAEFSKAVEEKTREAAPDPSITPGDPKYDVKNRKVSIPCHVKGGGCPETTWTFTVTLQGGATVALGAHSYLKDRLSFLAPEITDKAFAHFSPM
jgi:hypothetical protein